MAYHAAEFWMIIAIAVTSTLGTLGCGDEETGNAGASEGASSSSSSAGSSGPMLDVALTFEGRVGAEVFSCEKTFKGLGTAMSEVSISDFRLYVHDVRLHQKGGGPVPVQLDQDGLWQYKDVALLDFENKTGSCANGTTQTNGTVKGKVPEGEYDGISFKLGVPFALNHGDVSVAPSPLNVSGLFWNWNFGYKFIRVDSVAVATLAPFNLHLGSTGCQGDFAMGGISGCDRPNISEISFAGFDPTKSRVIVDYAEVIAESDLSAMSPDEAPGCMSGPMDPQCGSVFRRLGLDIASDALHPDDQKLFHVE